MASLPPGCTVIDPYVGTGTTMIAARDSGRKAIGIDLDCSIAADRCSQLNLLEAM
jgi:site-specific DNA-methyltransferase (adenine-specific)